MIEFQLRNGTRTGEGTNERSCALVSGLGPIAQLELNNQLTHLFRIVLPLARDCVAVPLLQSVARCSVPRQAQARHCRCDAKH